MPITIIYLIVVNLKSKFSKKKKFDIPVLCVGNLFIGGTGKTPMCMFISNELKKNGKKPVIIKKYYKNYEDEKLLIEKESHSLILNSNRKTALTLAERKFDLAILDDGFQDCSIHKNLSILCFNSEQLIGNGYVFPSGPLRESFSKIKNAQIIIINGEKKETFEKKIFRLNEKIKIFYSEYTIRNIENFQNKNILAIAGIGNPENFFSLLKKNGLNLRETIAYPDHYSFSQEEISKLEKKANEIDCNILTTEKDFMRIKNLKFNNIFSCAVNLTVYNEKKFFSEIRSLYV